jgi:hypothetical protein
VSAEVGGRRSLAFFLRKENGKPIVLDYYGNDESRPVAEAQEKIEMLRRLQNIGDLGILRGHVQQGPQSLIEEEAVPNAHVVARRTSDSTQLSRRLMQTVAMSFNRFLPESTH